MINEIRLGPESIFAWQGAFPHPISFHAESLVVHGRRVPEDELRLESATASTDHNVVFGLHPSGGCGIEKLMLNLAGDRGSSWLTGMVNIETVSSGSTFSLPE